MKYWRGYLIAILVSAFGWGLVEFAKSHVTLMDMVYPYMSRMIVSSMAEWSQGVDFCVWQVLLIAGIVLAVASVVLMIILKWNVIQWSGWVAAVASLVYLLNLGVYGLNVYTGDLADDIRLDVGVYTISDLELAAAHYRDQANKLAGQVSRDSDGDPDYEDFAKLAQQAGDGFHTLTYEKGLSVFAGSTIPVKELGLLEAFGSIDGYTFGVTGESAVNPQLPDLALPFVMSREMARRMSITNERDANFAAYMACAANSSTEFRYTAYCLAYNYCIQALEENTTTTAQAALSRVRAGEDSKLTHDLDSYNEYVGAVQEADQEETDQSTDVWDMLVSLYIQDYVVPNQVEEEVVFDPLDESKVDLTTTVEDISKTEG